MRYLFYQFQFALYFYRYQVQLLWQMEWEVLLCMNLCVLGMIILLERLFDWREILQPSKVFLFLLSMAFDEPSCIFFFYSTVALFSRCFLLYNFCYVLLM